MKKLFWFALGFLVGAFAAKPEAFQLNDPWGWDGGDVPTRNPRRSKP